MLDTTVQRRISILVYSDLEAAYDYLVACVRPRARPADPRRRRPGRPRRAPGGRRRGAASSRGARVRARVAPHPGRRDRQRGRHGRRRRRPLPPRVRAGRDHRLRAGRPALRLPRVQRARQRGRAVVVHEAARFEACRLPVQSSLHLPTPPIFSMAMWTIVPGGGSLAPGNLTSGPGYVARQLLKEFRPPPVVRRAVLSMTRYSTRPIGLVFTPSMDRVILGSRSRFCNFFHGPSEAKTISSPSSPTQTHVMCGVPSALSVTT